MKITTMLVFALSFGPAIFGYEVKIRVLNERDQIVSDADVIIDFVGHTQGSGSSYQGKTDKNGEFKAVGVAKNSVYLLAEKAGYYQARVDGLSKDKDIDYTITLPRIINPVPLFAKNARVKFPAQNKWLSFDFEAGDWVEPYGKGKTADILFKFKNECLGWKLNEEEMARSRQINADLPESDFKDFYGKWDAELEISFPDNKEGIHEGARFLAYSQLKLPHTAPVDGYEPTRRYVANNYVPTAHPDNMGYFLRTRVKFDKDGNIVSANYGKIMGDIHVGPQGSAWFTYYFNPTPNDRNLEWNPNRNLLQGLNNNETPRQP